MVEARVEEWLKEFYPVDADEVDRSELAAAEHSLRKWQGLREDVLLQYGLCIFNGNVCDHKGRVVLAIDGTTCSLCHRHLGDYAVNCDACSLAATVGSACSGLLPGRDRGWPTPWGVWNKDHNPEPMIAALQATVDRLRKEAVGE